MTAVMNKHENTYKASTQLDAQYLHFDSLFLSIKSFPTQNNYLFQKAHDLFVVDAT